jgi:hypothetical protein
MGAPWFGKAPLLFFPRADSGPIGFPALLLRQRSSAFQPDASSPQKKNRRGVSGRALFLLTLAERRPKEAETGRLATEKKKRKRVGESSSRFRTV